MSDPALLYHVPHPAHKDMAESIGAQMIESDHGGPFSRILTARSLDLGNQVLLTEGAQPLFQAAWMKIFGNVGSVIHLACDEALQNVVGNVAHYSEVDAFAHRWAHRHVDGVLSISPTLLTYAQSLGIDHALLVHPFTEDWKYEELSSINPDFGSGKILAVGGNRPKNNFDILDGIAQEMENSVEFHVIGGYTESIDGEYVTGHGYIEEREEFIAHFAESEAFILPGVSQAFSVAVLEALHAGLPPFITVDVGAYPYVHEIHHALVSNVDVKEIARSIDWYLNLQRHKKKELSEEAYRVGEKFNPDCGREVFAAQFQRMIQEMEEENDS